MFSHEMRTGHRRWEDSLQRIDEPDLDILPSGELRLIDTRRGSHNRSLREALLSVASYLRQCGWKRPPANVDPAISSSADTGSPATSGQTGHLLL